MMERTQSFFLKEPNSNDKIRIFCFPYAGGGASAYRNWGTYLPNYVGVYPIQIPGRENRITEKALTDMCKLRVKELRDAKHLTQTGLALKVGSTQQTISKIEREIGVPKLDLALIMADFFNVTLEYLFCLSDKKHKLEHQIEIDKTIEEFYDFFVDYQDSNSENKETLNLIMRRLLEVQANEEAE